MITEGQGRDDHNGAGVIREHGPGFYTIKLRDLQTACFCKSYETRVKRDGLVNSSPVVRAQQILV